MFSELQATIRHEVVHIIYQFDVQVQQPAASAADADDRRRAGAARWPATAPIGGVTPVPRQRPGRCGPTESRPVPASGRQPPPSRGERRPALSAPAELPAHGQPAHGQHRSVRVTAITRTRCRAAEVDP